MKIIIDIASLKASHLDKVVGKIWFESGNTCFPEKGWCDLPIPILEMWVDAWYELITRKKSKVELVFMDGPFLVEVSRLENDMVHLSFVERGLNHISRHELVILIVDFGVCIFDAVEEFIVWAAKNKYSNRVTAKLEYRFTLFFDGTGG